MKLAFHHGGKSALDDLIRFRTNSPNGAGIHAGATHVSYLFQSGDLFSSDIATHGTAFTDGSELKDAEHWQIVDLGDIVDEDLLREWCISHDHLSYGFVGDLCFLCDLKDFLPCRPFCSQVIVSGFQAQGVWTFLDPTESSPRQIQLMALAIQELQTPPKAA